VELDGLDRRILRLGQTGKNFQHFVLPDIDGHRERDARPQALARVARLADPMRGGGEDVVADALHVVAGVEHDRAGRRHQAHPLHVAAMEHLQPFHTRRGEEREEVDVLVAEQARGPGGILGGRDGRVVVEPQAEVRAGEPGVVQMGVAAEVLEETLHHRQNETLVRADQGVEERLLLRHRPEVGDVRRVKSPAAEHPALDEVGVHVAGLFDRKVALIHRAVALGAEAHLLVETAAREDLLDALLRFVVERRVDAMSFEDGEADLAQRVTELRGKGAFLVLVAVQVAADVARTDPEFIVELRGVDFAFGQLVGLPFLDLVVADEVLIGGVDAVFVAIHNIEHNRRRADRARGRLPRRRFA
jgi:hypothetical protein